MTSVLRGVNIRWMIRGDLRTVCTIERKIFEHAWTADDFRGALERDSMIGMVAESADRVCGYMVYAVRSNFIALESLGVDPKLIRQGIGLRLLEKLKEKAGQTRRRGVSVLVRESNLAAQLFFKAAGFRCIGIEPGAYPEYNSESGYRFRWLVGTR